MLHPAAPCYCPPCYCLQVASYTASLTTHLMNPVATHSVNTINNLAYQNVSAYYLYAKRCGGPGVWLRVWTARRVAEGVAIRPAVKARPQAKACSALHSSSTLSRTTSLRTLTVVHPQRHDSGGGGGGLTVVHPQRHDSGGGGGGLGPFQFRVQGRAGGRAHPHSLNPGPRRLIPDPGP